MGPVASGSPLYIHSVHLIPIRILVPDDPSLCDKSSVRPRDQNTERQRGPLDGDPRA